MANLKLPRRKFLHLAAGAAALVGTAMLLTMIDGAIAQEPSRRPIRIVVPFPPGGGADVLGRLLAQHITESSRRSVVVENRPGAGSIVGTEVVARAVPDGGTVLIVANAFVVNANLRSLRYDPLTSFEPICLLTDVPSLLVVNSASPFRSLNDFLDEARARPGALSMGTVGPAGVYHVTVETLKRAAKVNLTYVPYPGGAPAINALMGGHITSVMSNYGELIEHVKTGKLRVLAVPARDRLARSIRQGSAIFEG
jgi:tripartite-type tricarboxylate transporter receptor subunit TctC